MTDEQHTTERPGVMLTGDGIQWYRKQATLTGLSLEVHLVESGFPPTSGPTRGMAFASAKRILREYNVTPLRTRTQVLDQLIEVLGAKVIGEEEEAAPATTADAGQSRSVEGVLDRQEEDSQEVPGPSNRTDHREGS